MFDFKGVTHIISNPSGHAPGYNYSLVGHVPTSMLQARTPTTADVIGGRVQPDGYAYVGRQWNTVADILAAAADNQVTLCSSSTCSCRKLF